MTFPAGTFRHAQTARLDLDRVVEVARGEGERMKEAVLGLGEILLHEARWRVAIVAGRNRAMTRLRVGVQMIAHDVAIRAGVRIVAQI